MKGRGAYVKDKKRLNDNEFTVLKKLFEDPVVSYRGHDLVEMFGWSDRKVANALSNLHGLDLIKSSKYELTLTEDEKGVRWEGSAPHYWVGNVGQPIHKRAQYVIENKGSLQNILSGEMDFELHLYPFRLLRKVTVLSQIISITGKDVVLELLNDLTDQEVIDLELLANQKVRVTFESS
jgi:hypothetical protein